MSAKAKPGVGYFINSIGQTVEVPASQFGAAAEAGYLPASEEKIADFKKEEKYGTTGQQIKTGLEGAGQALTLGLSTPVERAFGVKPEDIKNREEVNPASHLGGTLLGVAAPLVLTGGASGAAEAGAAGAAEATAEGASGLLGAARAASKFTAPSLISRAGEGAAHVLSGVLPEATTGLGRIATKTALGAASAGTEGALFGVGHVVHEAGLGDPHLTWQSAAEEVGLSGLLGAGIGGVGGVLGGLTREAAASPAAKKLEEWLKTFEARNNLGQASGGQNIRAQLKKDILNHGWDSVNQMSREGRELGLGEQFSGAQRNFDLAEEIQGSRSEVMQATKEAVDSSKAGIEAQPSAASVASKARNKILGPLKENFADAGVASKFEKVVEDFEGKYGAGEPINKMTFSDLHEARQLLDKSIYGLKGDLTVNTNYKEALHEFRSLISKEITKGLENVPGAAAETWAKANREYGVASFFKKYAERGLLGQGGNNLFPLSTWIPALAGVVRGGPIGGLVMGAGGFLAKRYGPGALAAASRGAQRLVNEEGATALANKTADLIASERAAAAGEGGNMLARAFDVVGEKLEPALATTKDATRHTLRENVGTVESGATSEHEAVGALSHLEKARSEVEKRVHSLAGSIVSGRKLPQAEAAALGAHAAHENERDTHKAMENVRSLANNPELMQGHITSITGDVSTHAPNIAQAGAIHLSRAVSYLNQKFPAPKKMGPLGPTLKPTKTETILFRKTRAIIEKPTLLLHHASAGKLTPDMVAAVRETAPERLAQMQQAVLEKVAENNGKAPYKSRLMLSMLFGQDMDGTTTPEAIQAAQFAYALPSAKSPENQTGPRAGASSSQAGLSKLNVASQSRLPGQSSDLRRGNV